MAARAHRKVVNMAVDDRVVARHAFPQPDDLLEALREKEGDHRFHLNRSTSRHCEHSAQRTSTGSVPVRFLAVTSSFWFLHAPHQVLLQHALDGGLAVVRVAAGVQQALLGHHQGAAAGGGGGGAGPGAEDAGQRRLVRGLLMLLRAEAVERSSLPRVPFRPVQTADSYAQCCRNPPAHFRRPPTPPLRGSPLAIRVDGASLNVNWGLKHLRPGGLDQAPPGVVVDRPVLGRHEGGQAQQLLQRRAVAVVVPVHARYLAGAALGLGHKLRARRGDEGRGPGRQLACERKGSPHRSGWADTRVSRTCTPAAQRSAAQRSAARRRAVRRVGTAHSRWVPSRGSIRP